MQQEESAPTPRNPSQSTVITVTDIPQATPQIDKNSIGEKEDRKKSLPGNNKTPITAQSQEATPNGSVKITSPKYKRSPYYRLRRRNNNKPHSKTSSPKTEKTPTKSKITPFNIIQSTIESHISQQKKETEVLKQLIEESILAQNRQLAYHQELINVQLSTLLEENTKLQSALAQTKTPRKLSQEAEVIQTHEKSPATSHPVFQSPTQSNIAESSLIEENLQAKAAISSLKQQLRKKEEEFETYKNQFNLATFNEINQKNIALTKENKSLFENNKSLTKDIQKLTENLLEHQQNSAAKQPTAAPLPKSTLIITPRDNTSENSDLGSLKQVIESFPRPEHIKITKFRSSRKGLEIRCESELQKDNLKEYLQSTEAIKEKAVIQEKTPQQTKIILTNIPNEIPTNDITRILTEDNRIPRESIKSLDRQQTYSNERKSNIIIQLDRTVARQLLQQKYIYSDFVPIRCKRFVRLNRCKVCQKYNQHSTAQCTEKQICAYCSGSHVTDQCTAESPRCHNCILWNRKCREEGHPAEYLVDARHPAYDNHCPV